MKGADVVLCTIVQYNDWLEEEVKLILSCMNITSNYGTIWYGDTMQYMYVTILDNVYKPISRSVFTFLYMFKSILTSKDWYQLIAMYFGGNLNLFDYCMQCGNMAREGLRTQRRF